MNVGKTTSKGQMKLPKAIRERGSLREEEGAYLRGLEQTMSEWLTEEDEKAYRDL